MFQKPEELIMAVLGTLWVIATYYLSAYATDASFKYVMMITSFTMVWTIMAFFLWKTNHYQYLWPILLGLLSACWWPWLDWFAISSIPNDVEVLIIQKPWYASWRFKLVLSVSIIIMGYLFMWRRHRKQ